MDLGLLQSLTVRFNSNIFLVNLLDVLKIYVKTVEATKVIISNNVMLRIISLVEAKHEIVRTKAAKLIQKLSYNSFVFEYLINHNTIELLKKVRIVEIHPMYGHQTFLGEQIGSFEIAFFARSIKLYIGI